MCADFSSGAPEPSIDQLLKAAQGGGSQAFEPLYLAAYGPMLALALRLLGRREDAEEAVQEAFLRVYRNVARYDPSRPALPWLFRILSNEAHRLGGRRTGHLALDEQVVEEGPPGLPPEERVRFWQVLYSTLDAMGEGARTAFVLREFEGWHDGDIAQVLEVSEVTVRRHVMEARKRLRLQLDEFRKI